MSAVSSVSAIVDEIRNFCRENADPVRAAKYAHYFVEGYDAWGIDPKTTPFYANRDCWFEQLAAIGKTAYLDAGDLLLSSGKYEEGSFAILFAQLAAPSAGAAHVARLGKWFHGGIRNWGHTDVLCGEVLGPLALRGVYSAKARASWARSAWKFQRRAVPVTMLALIPNSDPEDLLTELAPLLPDKEKVVHQGLGWFLRELWKRHPKVVEAYLAKNRGSIPSLSVRTACEKMPAARKQAFRAARA